MPAAKDVRPTNSFGLYFTISINNIKNGSPGTMDFSSTILDSKREQTGTNFTALLGSEVKAQFSFDLAQDLQPTSVRGKGSYVVKEAKGEFAEFAAFAANLETEISPTEVKQLALRFSKSGAPLGEIRVSGPFDSAKSEGKLKAEILALDRHALNLLGAASGIDFGTTTVNGTSDIALTDGGAKISVAGSLDIARLQVTRAGQTSPALDLRCAYDVAVDSAAKSATLKAITLNGTQNQRALLRAELTSPMTVAWGSTAGAVGDSTFTVTVSDLGLADWRPFLGDTAPAGKLNAQTKIISKQGGKLLQIENATRVENLTVVAGGNRFANLSAEVNESVQATDLKQFKLTEYHAQVSQNGQAVVTIDATGAFDAEKQSTDADVKYLAAMPGLLQLARRPDLSASEGALAVTAHITQRGAAQAVTGNAQLVSFSGRAGQNIFRGYGAQVDFDIVKDGGRIGIKKAAGQLSEGAQAGGGFEANGSYDLGTGAGAVNLKLAGLNQNGLRPFLESALGGKKLVSVSLDSAAAASFAANGDSSVKADLKLANLVVRDPKSPKPDAPLEARAVVDASVAKNVATVRQCQLTLTPTQRAKNELNLSGSVDFSKPDAVTGT